MRTIFFLVGIPASGKSTWAKEQISKNPDRFKRVNKDLFRSMLDNSVYSFQKEKFLNSVRDYTIKLALRKGFDVIVDDTNFSDKHWSRVNEIAQEIGDVKVIEKFFPVDIKEALRRNQSRENAVSEHIIKNMYNKHIKNKKIEQREQYYPPIQQPFDAKLPSAIIVDIDGTLAFNDGHRSYYDYTKVLDDKPIKEVIELVQLYKSQGYTVLLVSGRKDTCREDTKIWLSTYEIKYDELYMREKDDNRQDYLVKKEIYNNHIKNKYNISFVLDDRNQIVDMWRGMGFRVFQVADGSF